MVLHLASGFVGSRLLEVDEVLLAVLDLVLHRWVLHHGVLEQDFDVAQVVHKLDDVQLFLDSVLALGQHLFELVTVLPMAAQAATAHPCLEEQKAFVHSFEFNVLVKNYLVPLRGGLLADGEIFDYHSLIVAGPRQEEVRVGGSCQKDVLGGIEDEHKLGKRIQEESKHSCQHLNNASNVSQEVQKTIYSPIMLHRLSLEEDV